MSNAEVVVVGGGLEGLAIAWALADRGVRDVLVLEREGLCSGGTAKSSSIVRCHYGVASLAAMSQRGVELFADAEEILGSDVGYRRTGYAVGVGPENADALRANVALQQSVGVGVREMSAADMRELWQGMYVDDFATFAYEPDGGRGDAYLLGMAFGSRARELGVRVRQQTPVTRLLTGDDGRVSGVETAGGERISAGTVVLANGPWSVALAEPLGVDLPVWAQRAQIVMVDPGEPLGEVPVFSDLVSLQYVRTEPSGELLFGNSDHSTPEYADPDTYRNRADDSFVEMAGEKLAHRFPSWAEPRMITSYAGCYDVTPDYNPVIGPAEVPGLFLAVGFSGHGFKLAPAVGRLVTDLIVDGVSGDPAIPAEDFRLARFAEGAPLVSRNPYAGAGQMR
ncbi:NAD(P)/FAD-dependent oxidoreductase [Amycolatopsis antarctica]|uniref:NAD(P)/FAD-dependent oxidoreductase n=1 Tax=Amycolatopsis antarctica TaxID=1854586 RepID=UPI001F0AD9EA|nr:FAD-dependent oxidoreductase [Amycolatopsis antarctica]